MNGKLRIVLSDDHPVVLAGLTKLIEAEDNFELVGNARNGLAALRLIRDKNPDVAVIDISMPGLNGIMLARRLADEAPSVRVVILTLHEDRAYVKQALDAGVRGYVLKRSAAESLILAIRAVGAGGLYVDPEIVDRVFEKTSGRSKRATIKRGLPDVSQLPDLTARETEVLKLVAIGFTNKEIARRIDVGVKSVETYKARGLKKLALKTRAELMRYASIQGWNSNM